jgi:molybdopterin-guanine dinucleotide biosynthesis protein A
MADILPVHGFVLAGGKSSRMGVDKALLPFCGRPMVEIAVEKLSVFCAEVGIAGNRDDLAQYGAVDHEMRSGIGPAAGVEAGLMAATQPWVLFVPVDVPLVPVELLQRWVQAVMQEHGQALSYLTVNERPQPAFCVMRKEWLASLTAAIEGGERRLARIWIEIGENAGLGGVRECDAAWFLPEHDVTSGVMERCFWNVNTPQELAEAEAWAHEHSLGADSRAS